MRQFLTRWFKMWFIHHVIHHVTGYRVPDSLRAVAFCPELLLGEKTQTAGEGGAHHWPSSECHGTAMVFVTNWGLGMVVGVNYYFILIA